MMVPLFGHHTYNKEEEASANKRMPIAILQFINKSDLSQVNQYDIVSESHFVVLTHSLLVQDKIEAMRSMLGQSIENASEHHTVINLRVGVVENLQNMENQISRGVDNSFQAMKNIVQIQEQPLAKLKSDLLTMKLSLLSKDNFPR